MGSQSPNLGALKPWSTWGDFNNIAFAIQQAIAKLQTATLVRVDACTNEGDLSPVGFVDITPLVNQIDGQGNPTPHITIYGLPYLRIQGGSNAVIIDPQPGDIGVAIFASRDISRVKSTKTQANPGSFRSYDFADGMYLGGMLNGVPVQYIRFGTDGITIVSPTVIKLQAPNIVIEGALELTDGDATMTGNLAVTGSVSAEGTDLHTHTHTSETPGTPTSPPL